MPCPGPSGSSAQMKDRRPLYLMAPALAWLTAFMVVPCLLILALAVLVSPWALALVLIYPLQITRLALRSGGGGEAWYNKYASHPLM